MVARTSSIGTFNLGDVWNDTHVDSLPAGWLGYLEKLTDQTGITGQVDISGLNTLAVTLNAGRRIRISSHVVAGGSVVGDRFNVAIVEGSTQLMGDPQVNPIADNSIGSMKFSPTAILTPTAGAHTYKLVMARISGTGNASVQAAAGQAAWLLVEDIGPA